MKIAFKPSLAYGGGNATTLPFRAADVPGISNTLISTDAGEHLFVPRAVYDALRSGGVRREAEQYEDLLAKGFAAEDVPLARRLSDAKLRTRKSFVQDGQTLHIFVVSLRCDHGCHYCQVSRRAESGGFDMSSETAGAAVKLVFASPASHLTVEFQGGEPLLAFDRVREIVECVELQNRTERRRITYTITSTLHHLTDEILAFLARHRFQVSTSLDGPEALHNTNRPVPTQDSHQRTLHGIARVRECLGADALSALTTLTRESLKHPEAIVDEYVRLGFRSIFLRPLSPYGFARRSARKTGYEMDAFVRFYDRALNHMLALNRGGVELSEVYAGILLSHILTPFPSSYVDLRSPAGAGANVLVYNYDGGVYASDEGRMLAEMGDQTFRLGSVHEPHPALMASSGMARVRERATAEALSPCAECAFVPFCGADPVHSHAAKAPVTAPAAAHCQRHLGLFNILFRHLANGEPDVVRTLQAWALRRPVSDIRSVDA